MRLAYEVLRSSPEKNSMDIQGTEAGRPDVKYRRVTNAAKICGFIVAVDVYYRAHVI